MNDNDKLLLGSRIKARLEKSTREKHIALLRYIIYDLDPTILVPGMKASLGKNYTIINPILCPDDKLKAIAEFLDK